MALPITPATFLKLDQVIVAVVVLCATRPKNCLLSLTLLLVSTWRDFLISIQILKTPQLRLWEEPLLLLFWSDQAFSPSGTGQSQSCPTGTLASVSDPTRATCACVHGHTGHMPFTVLEFDLRVGPCEPFGIGALCSHVRPTATTPDDIADQPCLRPYVTIYIIGRRNTAGHTCRNPTNCRANVLVLTYPPICVS